MPRTHLLSVRTSPENAARRKPGRRREVLVATRCVRRALFLAALVCLCALTAPRGYAQTTPTIVALGASNTDGWGVDRSEAYPARLQALLKTKGIDVSVRNAGIPGDTTGDMLARLDGWLSDGVHLVILQPGTNDERMGLAAERAGNVEKIRAALQGRGIKLLVIENDVLDALPRSELRADGIHFTPAGYALLAERILPQVESALAR